LIKTVGIDAAARDQARDERAMTEVVMGRRTPPGEIVELVNASVEVGHRRDPRSRMATRTLPPVGDSDVNPTAVRAALASHGAGGTTGGLSPIEPLARTFPSAEMPVIEGFRESVSMSPLCTSAETAPTN
jgi:hypothetical protein